jgi:hypothetical protein
MFAIRSVRYVLGLLVMGWLFSPTVLALPPIGKEVKMDPKIMSTSLSPEKLYKSGYRLILALNDKTKVIGRLVWADEDNDYMMIRLRPGTLPRKLAGKDIANIDRIRLVGATGETIEDQPEIHKVTVMNGGFDQVKYFATDLSPKEKAQLARLETAENQMLRARFNLQTAMNYMRAESELQSLRNQQQQIMTNRLSWGMFPPYENYYGFGAFPGFYTTGQPAVSELAAMMGQQKNLETQLAEARSKLNLARKHAIFEGSEIVAVIPEAGKSTAPSKN